MIDYKQLAAQLASNAESPNQLLSDWERQYFLTTPNFWNDLLTAFQLIYNKTAERLYAITDLNPELKDDNVLSKDRDLQRPLVFLLRKKVSGLCKTTTFKTSINELEMGCNCDKCPLLLKISERVKAEVQPEAKAQLSTLPPEFSRHFLEAEIKDALSQQREAKEAATKPGANLGGCSEMYIFNVERIKALQEVFAPPVDKSGVKADPQLSTVKAVILKVLLQHPPGNHPTETYKLVAPKTPLTKRGEVRNASDIGRRRSQFMNGEVTFKKPVINLIIRELELSGNLKDRELAEAVKRNAS